MIVFSDNKEYADKILPGDGNWAALDDAVSDPNLSPLMQRLYGERPLNQISRRSEGRWEYVFIVKKAPSSHFDHLIQLRQTNIELPDGIICHAGSGRKLHGQRGRSWAAREGNIHLSVYLAPKQIIKRYHTGFPILVAASIIDTIDTLKGLQGRAGIKWVNDVLIDGAKVAGFLVHTFSSMDTVIAAVLGIGLNVEKTPRVKPDPYVPKVCSLRDFVQESSLCTLSEVLTKLLECLDNNYNRLLDGKYSELLDSYRKRSLVVGQSVKILSDTPGKKQKEIASGIVKEIGENLELVLDGGKKPVTKGRLILI
jgi:BirA family biotin operon repressor/biotin-[acetyl-CoA-carboxylase] ligase